MSTSTEPIAEIVWSWTDLPDDSYITDHVIKEADESLAVLVAAMAESRAARAEQ
jgi:hypothetical protein